MDFYITDRTFQLKTVTSTNGDTPFKVISAEDVSTLETSSRRMTMEISFTPSTTDQAKDFFKVGNYVLYVDLNGKYEWMTILKATHNPLTQVRTLECEDAGLDLLNETVSDYKADKAYNIAYYINKFTYDSGFKIGVNEIPNLTRKLEWEGEATALERIQSVATQFDNAELEFSFDFVGNELKQRYIDIKKKRGTTDFHRMYVNRDIHSIVVEEDIYELVNAIYAIGGTEEGKDTPINLKGFTWTDPEGRFVLNKSDGIIRDTQNIKQWSRENNNSHYFVQYKTYETTNKTTLVNNVVSHLKKYSQPVTNYIVDIANIPDILQVGDTVELVDENEKLYLSSRVQQLTFNYESNTCEAVLSDFVRLQSGIAEQLRDIQIKVDNETTAKLNSVPRVFVQEEPPVNPKQGDMWWVVDGTVPQPTIARLGDYETREVKENPKITSYKVWDDLKTEWVEQTIDQAVLNIETLNAITMNGSTINGSEFLNTFKATVAGEQLEGVSTVGGGEVEIEYLNKTTNLNGSTRMYSQGFDARVLNADNSVNRYASLTPAGLSLQDSLGHSGFLTAELVMQFSNTGRKLYGGNSWVGENDIIRPTLSMSDVAVGWLFLWQPYNTTTGTPSTWDYSYFLVPKAHANYNNGKGIVMRLQGASNGDGANDTIFKYIYVSNSEIKGRIENRQGNGAKWVLTGVFSV